MSESFYDIKVINLAVPVNVTVETAYFTFLMFRDWIYNQQ